MNFLAHYHFDHIKGNHLYNTGLLLPDLTRNFKREWKIKYDRTEGELSPETGLLLKGCLKHEKRDLIFHNSTSFVMACEEVKQMIKKTSSSISNTRPSFMSHIMVELLLDRIILKTKAGVTSNMYHDLEKTGIELFSEFLLAMGFAPEKKFSLFYQRFVKSRYLESYADNESFLFALNRVFSKVNQPFLEISHKNPYLLIKEAEKIVSTYYSHEL